MRPISLLLVLALPQMLSGQISLGVSQDITNYVKWPAGTTVTDLDGDLDPDIIAYERWCWRIVWWENDGEGNFSRTREWNPPLDDPENWFQAVGLGDSNGDGVTDGFYLKLTHVKDVFGNFLVRPVSLHVAEADGNGSFELSEALIDDFLEGDDFIVYPIRDFDGNGTPDLVLDRAVYLSDSSGQFSERIDFGFEIEREDLLTDWENDGDLDLITEEFDWDRDLSIFKIRLNQGGGVFSDDTLLERPNEISSFFGIGDQLGAYPNGLLVFPETEEGTILEVHTETEGGLNEVVASLNVEELAEFDEWISIWLFAGPNNRVFFSSHVSFLVPREKETGIYELVWSGNTLEVKTISTGHPHWLIPSEVGFADLDQDGPEDLLVTVQANDRISGQVESHLFWFRTDSEGAYEEERFITEPAWGLEVAFAEDINDDGMVDLVGYQWDEDGRASPDLTVWRNQNQGTTFESERIESSDSTYRVFDIVDITKDNYGRTLNLAAPEGYSDFFVTENFGELLSPRTSVRILLQDEESKFDSLYLFHETFSINQIYRVDWDGDGLKDLVYVKDGGTDWRAHDSVVWRKCLNGLASFENGFRLILELDGAELLGSPEDFDQDGDLDLPLSLDWIETPGKSVWARTGENYTIESLEFGPESKLGILRDAFINGRHREVDLDGDGDLDLIGVSHHFRRSDFGGLHWFEKKGPEQYEPSFDTRDSTHLIGHPLVDVRAVSRNSLVMGDMDGDGVKDLVAGSNSRLEWFKVTQEPQSLVYETWAIENSLSGHSAAPGADWDGDFFSNWAEFAFGTNPLVADPAHPGKPHVEKSPTGQALLFRRRVRAEAEGLDYFRWISPDLRNWLPMETAAPTVIPVDGDYEEVSFPVDPLLERAFFRVDPSMPTLE